MERGTTDMRARNAEYGMMCYVWYVMVDAEASSFSSSPPLPSRSPPPLFPSEPSNSQGSTTVPHMVQPLRFPPSPSSSTHCPGAPNDSSRSRSKGTAGK